MIRNAIISDDGLYRWILTRNWESGLGIVAVIGLNPSTADANIDDPTIRRTVNFAKMWNFRGLIMMNLFALRSTDPKLLKVTEDPVGPRNEEMFSKILPRCNRIVCAWGVGGVLNGQDKKALQWVINSGHKPYVLRLTKAGHPSHPLYLPKDLYPVEWEI